MLYVVHTAIDLLKGFEIILKKIISVILIFALSLTVFAGCSDNVGSTSQSNISANSSGNTSSDASSAGSTAISDSSSNVMTSSSAASEVTSSDNTSQNDSSAFSDRNAIRNILNSSSVSSDPKFSVPDDDYIIPPETNNDNLYYYYNVLPDYLKDSYCKLTAAIANCKMSCKLDIEPTDAELSILYSCITFDNPQFFHIYSYDQGNYFMHSPNDNSVIYIMYDYQVSEDNASPDVNAIKEYIEQINENMKAPLYEANKYSSVYDKIAYLYYWLVDETNISWSDYNAHSHSTVKELLVDKHGVCIGYALTLSFLIRQLDVVTSVGSGVNSSDVEHTWTLVKLDGKYYACDTYFANEHRVNFEHSSAEYLLMENYDTETNMRVDVYAVFKGPNLG